MISKEKIKGKTYAGIDEGVTEEELREGLGLYGRVLQVDLYIYIYVYHIYIYIHIRV